MSLSPSIHKFDDVFIYSIRPSEPFGLRHVDELMSSRSGSKTIAKIILIRIGYSICESKHLVALLCFVNLFFNENPDQFLVKFANLSFFL